MVVSLESAVIALERDPSQSVSFQMMPDTFRETVSANYSNISIIGRSEPIRVYKNSNGRQIAFTLNFYTSIHEEDEGSVFFMRQKVKFLQSLTYPERLESGIVTSPPVVNLTVGELFDSRGLIRSVNVVWYGTWHLVDNREDVALAEEQNDLISNQNAPLQEDFAGPPQPQQDLQEVPDLTQYPEHPMGAKVELVYEEVNLVPKVQVDLINGTKNPPLGGGFSGPSFDGDVVGPSL